MEIASQEEQRARDGAEELDEVGGDVEEGAPGGELGGASGAAKREEEGEKVPRLF